MIPFIRIIVILAKTFTKPLAEVTKSAVAEYSSHSRKRIIKLGNMLYRCEVRIHRKFHGITTETVEIAPLSDDAAFERAFNFILEILAYSILFGVAVQEVRFSQEDKKQIKADIEDLKGNVRKLESQLQEQVLQSKILEKKFSDYQNNEKNLIETLNQIKTYNEQQEKKLAERDDKFMNMLDKYSEQLTSLRREINFNSEKKSQDQF